MKMFKTLLVTGVLMALAIGCGTTKSKEDMLSAAGFKMVPADSLEKEAHLKSLPADKISPVQRNGTVYYTFPDPKQNVLYVGGQPEYQQYQNLRQQKQMEAQQLNALEMDNPRWGVWGTWGAPYGAWR